jgi:hypothetical protein
MSKLVKKGDWLIDTTSKVAYKHANGAWFLVKRWNGIERGIHWSILPEFVRVRFLDQAKKAA